MSLDGPNLEQARKRAKELLRRARAGEPESLARFVRRDRPPQLADAQLVIARELGFSSWPALVAAVGPDEESARAATHGLAEVLELLHDSRRRWRTLRATGTEWRDDELAGAAFLRSIPPGGVVSSRGHPEPGDAQHQWKVWVSQPDRARTETTGPHGGRTAVHRRDSSWNSMPPHHGGGQVGGPVPDVVAASWPACLLLDTAMLSARFHLEAVGRRVVAGRRTVVVEGRPANPRTVAPMGPLRGADQLELAVDVERGVLLSLVATLDDVPYFRLEIDDVAFDEPIDDDLFATHERATLEEQPVPPVRNGPPEGVLGGMVPWPPLIARNDSVVVAVERIVAYPKGFEVGVTVWERPGHDSGTDNPSRGRSGRTPSQTPAEDLEFTIVFADGARGDSRYGSRDRPHSSEPPAPAGPGTGPRRMDERPQQRTAV